MGGSDTVRQEHLIKLVYLLLVYIYLSIAIHFLTLLLSPSLPPSLLSSPRYDRFGEAGVEGRGFGGGPQFVDDFDIGDIFDSFFGGTFCCASAPSLPPSFPRSGVC